MLVETWYNAGRSNLLEIIVMRIAAVLLCTVALEANIAAAEVEYPRPELLVEPETLYSPIPTSPFSSAHETLDLRSQEDYEKGHFANSQRVDPAVWAKAFGDGKDAEGWGKRIGALGIGPETPVLVYDDGNGKDAARVWWILRYWGVEDVRLLNGGWAALDKTRLPIQTDTPEPPTPVKFKAEPRSERFADKDTVLGSLKNKSLQIVDTRSNDEFCGVAKSSNKKSGAIPGAKHLEWSDLIQPETKKFKKPDELRELFKHAGIDLKKPTATHCQGGGRASVVAFGMELMGAKDVRNYYKGWSEWGNAEDTPVEKPKGE